MDRLRGTYKGTKSVNGTFSLFTLESPANQKTKLSANLFFEDATGDSIVVADVRRRGTDDGTKGSAITWTKQDDQDAETIQSVGYAYSATATNDGTAIRSASRPSNSFAQFLNIPLNGGSATSVFITTTKAVTIRYEFTVEE